MPVPHAQLVAPLLQPSLVLRNCGRAHMQHYRHRGHAPAIAPLGAIVCVALALRAFGEEPPAPRIARLIEQLGSERYSERAHATSELARLG